VPRVVTLRVEHPAERVTINHFQVFSRQVFSRIVVHLLGTRPVGPRPMGHPGAVCIVSQQR
jgi:hypothetical protein